MNQYAKEINESKPKICLIGVGDTGVKLVETLAMVAPEEVEAYSLDTDSRSLTRCHQSRALLLGQAIPCGLGTGGDSALARAAVKSDKKALLDLVQGTDLVFLLTGLGGGTGTGAAPFIADLAKRAGALVVGVAATPFDCEGVQRANQAIGGLRDLKQVADAVFHFPNEDILRMEGDQLSLNRALDIANRHLCEAVLGVSRMLLESGMLNVSFADIQALLRDRHSLGMVVQGHDSTLPVTIDHMVYHTQAVMRGSQRALVVADMPFMSYQASVSDALRNAGRLLAEGGAQAVKVEGGARCVPVVRALVEA
ncbi:MAG: 3-methyl-2-oxobutanoate hydroxymethyltransferase, partial [Verrucomicrobiota bacterium]|nr:3-methyl-2-oxobutanoate hydroxymethyltransferase [Verrucomicrobiota bacterium]